MTFGFLLSTLDFLSPWPGWLLVLLAAFTIPYTWGNRSGGRPKATVRLTSDWYPCTETPMSNRTTSPAFSFVSPAEAWGMAERGPN